MRFGFGFVREHVPVVFQPCVPVVPAAPVSLPRVAVVPVSLARVPAGLQPLSPMHACRLLSNLVLSPYFRAYRAYIMVKQYKIIQQKEGVI